jgi:hypothetical protein
VKNLDSDSILNAVLKKLGEKYEYIKSLRGGGFSRVYLEFKGTGRKRR